MPARRDFPGRRWLNIGLRSLHLAGVVLAGVAIVGNGAFSHAAAALMLVTGFGLYGIDLWAQPDLWKELVGVFIALKLALLLAMLLVPAAAAPLFWFLLVASAVVSHAPRDFRHRRILG